MKVGIYEQLVRAGATRRDVLKGAASMAALAAASSGTLGALTRPAAAQDNLRAQILQDPRRRHRSADRCRLAEGRRALPRRDQGQRQGRRVCRRRAALHGPQQPESAQRAVPRLAEAVGGLYRRQDHLDRPCAGRLQCPPAAGDRDRHGRLRHHRDGRAVRGRRLRQGPGLRNAGLGRQADRHGRLCRLPEGAGRHLGRQDLSPVDRRRLPHLQLPHRRLLRRRSRRSLEGRAADRANGACRRPGSRCRPSPSS